MIRPKKRLGQHFLTDRKIATRITGYLKASDYRRLIEIGPGRGILTESLLERDDIDLYAVEIDHEAVEFLLQKYPGIKGKLIERDFLTIDLVTEFPDRFGIIGNFPYNISSQIFFKILSDKDNCREIVCMLQKEVAERIISPPGNKIYGILSVLLQTWYDTEYLFTVKPGSFFPKPEVRSSVIRMIRNSRMDLPVPWEYFQSFVKAAFNQRRKVLRNSLKTFLSNSGNLNPLLSKRPEDLSIDEFIKLAVFARKENGRG